MQYFYNFRKNTWYILWAICITQAQTSINNSGHRYTATRPLQESPASGDRSLYSLLSLPLSPPREPAPRSLINFLRTPVTLFFFLKQSLKGIKHFFPFYCEILLITFHSKAVFRKCTTKIMDIVSINTFLKK